ncbi:MAG: alpha-isopropylmalate synthase regulatory domain-containing protein, partial [Pseudomonadales bacterium]
FKSTYMNSDNTLKIQSYEIKRADGQDQIHIEIEPGHFITGTGRGAMDAFCNAIAQHWATEIVVVEYAEHTTGTDAQAEAMAYVQLGVQGVRVCGAARSEDILDASLQAVLNALANETLALQSVA